jgi:sec-independent protein translocase protein TatB
MPDVSWGELLIVGIVALVVIGPKDLPRVMRTCGQWLRKLRGLAADFQGQMALIDRELELEELRKQLREMRDPELEQQIEKVMTEERRVRPPAPVAVDQWAGSAAGVEEHELLPADLDALRAIDDEAASRAAPMPATATAAIDAERDADANLESSRYLGADDFLAAEPVRKAAQSETKVEAKVEAEAGPPEPAGAPARQKAGDAEDPA